MGTTAVGSPRFVAYERVSTKRQGASGLGLEAQRKPLDDFVAPCGAEFIARFTDVESGRVADRPELAKALHLGKVTGATLLIAKLDRLSRNAAFLLTLRDSGVRFVAADMPEAKTSPSESWRWSPSRSGRRSHGAPERRWRRPGPAECGLGNPKRGRGAQAGWEGRSAAQGGDCAERRPARRESTGGRRGDRCAQ